MNPVRYTDKFHKLYRFTRMVSTTNVLKTAYESDGKSTVTVLNKELGSSIMVDSYSKFGFRLNNGMFVLGAMVLFPHTAMSWRVNGDNEINQDSLSLFCLIEPKLDILVVGYGNKDTDSRLLYQKVLALKKRTQINVEVLPVDKAAPTFNYLSSEKRWVAGAFIPPDKIYLLEHEIMNDRMKKRETYKMNEYFF